MSTPAALAGLRGLERTCQERTCQEPPAGAVCHPLIEIAVINGKKV
jgi:hypothetical protein